MAIVQVDLSEYDMLRQAKQKAEDECAELKENIKAINNSSKAIVKTVHVKNRVQFDIDKIISNTIQKYTDYERRRFDSPFWDNSINSTVLYESLHAALHVRDAFSYKEDAEGEVSESFVNFEDVRIKVENKMQDEINKSIKECDNAKTEYLARKDQLDKEKDEIIQKYKEECYKQLEARFDQQITGLKYNLTEQSGKVSHLQGVIDTKDEEIAKLKEEIEALTKKKSHWWN